MLSLIYLIFSISIINAGLGLFVLLRNWRETINIIFALFSFIVSSWIFATGMLLLNPTLLWGKITILNGFLIGIIFLVFAKFFPKVDKKPTLRFYLLLFVPTIIFLLTLPSNLVLRNVVIEHGIPTPIFGPFFPISGIFGLFLVLYGILLFYKKFKTATGIEKLQIKYVFLGLGLFVVSAFINGAILPTAGITQLSFFSSTFSFFLIGFIFLAITRYHLFGIKVILIEILVGVMGIILFILPFLMPTITLKILTIFIFLLFLIFGYYLIKATYREIKAKEILEEKVKERTKELEKAKEELEKAKEELEKAYNQVLIEKDKFERLYKATLGREMRIIELKEEVRSLKEEIEKLKGKNRELNNTF